MTSSDPDKPLVLATLPTEVLASLLLAQLQDAGLRAEMVGALTSAFRAEAPGGVQILVRSEDHAQALKILGEFEKHGD